MATIRWRSAMQPSGLFDDLAVHFTRPARSGVYLTKNEIIALARISDASLRINERPRMLADVLRSAQSAEELTALFDRLASFCLKALADYEDLVRRYPASATSLRVLQEQARRSLERLAIAKEELEMESEPLD